MSPTTEQVVEHLERALEESSDPDANYHIRQAMQAVEVLERSEAGQARRAFDD